MMSVPMFGILSRSMYGLSRTVYGLSRTMYGFGNVCMCPMVIDITYLEP